MRNKFLLIFLAFPLLTQAQQMRVLKVKNPNRVIIERPGKEGSGMNLRGDLTERTLNLKKNGLDTVFSVTYLGFPGDGVAREAIQRAVDKWETLINSEVKINIQASWTPFQELNVLGGSTWNGEAYLNFPNTRVPNSWYLTALAEKLARTNLNGDAPDIILQFNSRFEGWDFGETATPNQINLQTVALHEIGHGLGFASFFTLVDENGDGFYLAQTVGGETFPEAFVSFIESGTTPLTSVPEGSAAGNAMTGDNLFFDSELTNIVFNSLPDKRAKLFAPSEFDGGSSIGHLDNVYDNTPNALMTPSVNSNEFIASPGVSFDMLADIGWLYTFIEHDSLNDIEDFTVPRTVTATITSDTEIDSASFKLLYSINNGMDVISDTTLMTHQGGGIFSGEIPAPGSEALVSYHLVINDEFGRLFLQPSFAPDFRFQYFARPDEEAPTLSHTVPVNFIVENETGVDLIANVFDNLGIESVEVVFRVKGVDQPSFFMDFSPGEFAPGRYTGTMDLSGVTLSAGDVVEYRIIATDSSSNNNQAFSPTATTFHTLPVEGLAQATEEYENDFTNDANDFLGDLFTRLTPAGFVDPAFHSDHPYAAAGQGNEIDFITQLRFPIILKDDSAFIQFDEIVLVEPGQPGTVFGNDNFWDYVVVEGSKDGGNNWTPFIPGYDSGFDPDWLATWNQLNSNGQDSDGLGSPDLYKNRVIDMLANGAFNPGDEVLVRFRLFSDPFAFGWGWAIDNLKIQKELVVGIDDLVKQESFSVYPNPLESGNLNVRASLLKPVSKVRLTMMNLLGNLVFDKELMNVSEQINEQIDISSLPTGVYIFQMQLDDGVLTRKLIKP